MGKIRRYAIADAQPQKTIWQPCTDALDVYLIGSKLRLACLMESHRVVFNTAYDTTFLPDLLAFLPEQSDLCAVPIIALYTTIVYQALTAEKRRSSGPFAANWKARMLPCPPRNDAPFYCWP